MKKRKRRNKRSFGDHSWDVCENEFEGEGGGGVVVEFLDVFEGFEAGGEGGE